MTRKISLKDTYLGGERKVGQVVFGWSGGWTMKTWRLGTVLELDFVGWQEARVGFNIGPFYLELYGILVPKR